MRSVLLDRVVESVFVAMEILRPFLGLLTAVDFARVVFCFDDEDAVGRDDDMVDLGSSVEVWDDDIVESHIVLFGEAMEATGDRILPYCAFEMGWGEKVCPGS